MAARVFRPLGRVFERSFREDGVHYWKRYDAAAADRIELIFNPAREAADSDGVEVVGGIPVAYISKAELLRLAPGRAALDSSLWVSNRDTLTIDGKVWRVECCRFDGFAMCEIPLLSGVQQ